MKYCSIDIETTGLNPERHQILEFGAIVDDLSDPRPFEELPKFHTYIIHDHIVGDPFALAMNADILRIIANRHDDEYKDLQFYEPDRFPQWFGRWLDEQCPGGDVTPAGKNFGSFDLQFLSRISTWEGWVNIGHRTLDPGSLYFDPKVDDKIPNLSKCKERAGLDDTTVDHTAISDAWDVCQVLRKKFL
jgi:oligoribonuclease